MKLYQMAISNMLTELAMHFCIGGKILLTCLFVHSKALRNTELQRY